VPKKEKTYPSRVLEEGLREKNIPVQIFWETPGPKDTMVAWISCLMVGNKGVLILVETYFEGGWECFIQSRVGKVDDTIAEVERAAS